MIFFSKILTKTDIFWKCEEIKNFRYFRRNGNFSKILTNIELFRKFDQNRDFKNIEIFQKFRPNSKFCENFHQNLTKSEIFEKKI